jgi:hypothetical protein
MPSAKQLRGATSPKITVPVTEEIIASAIPRDSGHCMVADAVRAMRPDAIFVAVDIQTIRFTEAGRRYVYLTPRTVIQALLDFDHGDKPEPFTFRLRNAHVMQAGKKVPKTPAELKLNHSGGSAPPVRVGGQAPPTGPLSNVGTNRGNRTGQRREFGLRAILR